MISIDAYSKKFLNRFHDKLVNPDEKSHKLDKKQLPFFLKGAFAAEEFISGHYLNGSERMIKDYRKGGDEKVHVTVGLNKDYGIFKNIIGHDSEKLYDALKKRLSLFLGVLPTSIDQEIVIPDSHEKILHLPIPKDLELIDRIKVLIQQCIRDGVVDFTRLKIQNFNLNNLVLKSTNSESNKRPLNMQKCIFNNVDFIKATLDNVDMLDTQFYGVNFQGAILKNVVFKNADLTHINFEYCIIKDCIFDNCIISDVSVANATLEGIKFQNCRVSKVNNLYLAHTKDLISENTHLSGVMVTGEQKDQLKLSLGADKKLFNKNDYAKYLDSLIKYCVIKNSEVPKRIKAYILGNKLEDSISGASFEFADDTKNIIFIRDNEFIRIYAEEVLVNLLREGYVFHPLNKNYIMPKHFMQLSELQSESLSMNLEKIQT